MDYIALFNAPLCMCSPVDDVGYLWDTALMLELGWKKSRSNAQLQLMLLKIYGELG